MSSSTPTSLGTHQLRENTKEYVRRESQGSTAGFLLDSARIQLSNGKELKAQGQLDAFIAFTKVGTLTRLSYAKAAASMDKDLQREIMEFTKASKSPTLFCLELTTRIDSPLSQLNSSQLKKRTAGQLQRESRGANAASLLDGAQKQFLLGEEFQAKGQVVDAYVAFAKTATLTRLSVTQVGISKDQVMKRKIMEFMKLNSGRLADATESLARRIDAALSQPRPENSEPQNAFPSLADRIKRLTNDGLVVERQKPLSENGILPDGGGKLPERHPPLQYSSVEFHFPSEDEFTARYPKIDDSIKVPSQPPTAPASSAMANGRIQHGLLRQRVTYPDLV
ncbi:hypothetical protein DL96DRAFT_1715521 [Flagelloscypha sp. PMI_526]|nr:hypothetical protein DL96DRAFT_1715521 [Flagelloscypha sp. PMI_526]